MFIVFEGIDGCGKSTQLKLLQTFLRLECDLDVLATREPGGTLLGESLEAALKSTNHNLTNNAKFFLFLADRIHHAESVIRPALARQQVVICDRYHFSTFAYQVFYQHFSKTQQDIWDCARISQIFDITSDLIPIADLTIIFKIDPKIALSRKVPQDSFESSPLTYFKRVAAAYDQLAIEDRRCHQIDTSGLSIDAVFDQVKQVVLEYLPDLKTKILSI